jgi:Sec-independent protein translocase protein TatA
MKMGTMELIVVLLVAFLVLGPEKTVLYTRKLGKSLRTLKIYMNSFTDDLKETVVEPLQEIQEPLNDLVKPLEDVTKSVQQPIDELNANLAINEAKLKAKPSLSSKPKTENQQKTTEEVIEVAEIVQDTTSSSN